MNRETLAALGRETLNILSEGRYQSSSGLAVDVSGSLSDCVSATRLFRPADFPEEIAAVLISHAERPIVEVTWETTLQAARRLIGEEPATDQEPLCLNFASARHPGGGFLSGSQAQEESLARSSGLYASISRQGEMYEHNRALRTCLYSDYMIYSPRVPVFRHDRGDLLDEPYVVSFITAPAVNAAAVRKNEPHNIPDILPTMRRRLARLLWAAQQMQHSTLVLGAWGCGVFGNDPASVAELFHQALGRDGSFANCFRRIVYAVHDRSSGQAVYSAFHRVLADDGD
jgi:uncharacterized protein (TIGR02452 family)